MVAHRLLSHCGSLGLNLRSAGVASEDDRRADFQRIKLTVAIVDTRSGVEGERYELTSGRVGVGVDERIDGNGVAILRNLHGEVTIFVATLRIAEVTSHNDSRRIVVLGIEVNTHKVALVDVVIIVEPARHRIEVSNIEGNGYIALSVDFEIPLRTEVFNHRRACCTIVGGRVEELKCGTVLEVGHSLCLEVKAIHKDAVESPILGVLFVGSSLELLIVTIHNGCIVTILSVDVINLLREGLGILNVASDNLTRTVNNNKLKGLLASLLVDVTYTCEDFCGSGPRTFEALEVLVLNTLGSVEVFCEGGNERRNSLATLVVDTHNNASEFLVGCCGDFEVETCIGVNQTKNAGQVVFFVFAVCIENICERHTCHCELFGGAHSIYCINKVFGSTLDVEDNFIGSCQLLLRSDDNLRCGFGGVGELELQRGETLFVTIELAFCVVATQAYCKYTVVVATAELLEPLAECHLNGTTEVVTICVLPRIERDVGSNEHTKVASGVPLHKVGVDIAIVCIEVVDEGLVGILFENTECYPLNLGVGNLKCEDTVTGRSLNANFDTLGIQYLGEFGGDNLFVEEASPVFALIENLPFVATANIVTPKHSRRIEGDVVTQVLLRGTIGPTQYSLNVAPLVLTEHYNGGLTRCNRTIVVCLDVVAVFVINGSKLVCEVVGCTLLSAVVIPFVVHNKARCAVVATFCVVIKTAEIVVVPSYDVSNSPPDNVVVCLHLGINLQVNFEVVVVDVVDANLLGKINGVDASNGYNTIEELIATCNLASKIDNILAVGREF